MSVSPEAIANKFIDLSTEDRGYSVSNMKLQKLVYIAHGFCLGFYGKPLSNCDAHAWQYGPVFPQLYHKLKKYGAGRVTEHVEATDCIPDASIESELINDVWDAYGEHTAVMLMSRTHKPDSPWDKVWKKHGESRATIPNESIRDHFEDLIKALEKD